MVEYHNLDKASHIRDKLTEMIHLSETLHASPLASAYEGIQTKAGAFAVNPFTPTLSS